MHAHIQRSGQCDRQCGGLIRVFEDGKNYGDPYTYAFLFHEIDDNTIEIYGVAGRAPTPSEGRAMHPLGMLNSQHADKDAPMTISRTIARPVNT